MLLISASVIARYTFHYGQAWSIEATMCCLFFGTLSGTAWVLRRDRHIKLDVLVARFPLRTQAMLEIVLCFISIITMGILLPYAIEANRLALEKGYEYGLGLRLPMITLLWIFPFGIVTLFIQFIRRAYEFFKVWKAPTATDES